MKIQLKNKLKGFTLIELLVVVAIIGILAAVGVVAYSGYTSSAKKNATKANHKLMIKYVEAELIKCELGETTIMENLLNCNKRTDASSIVLAVKGVFDKKIKDVFNPSATSALTIGTVYDCYPNGTYKTSGQGQHALTKGLLNGITHTFIVETCVESKGKPLKSTIIIP